MTVQVFTPGGYRFIPAVFQYSGGVGAEPGFQVERVVFCEPLPLKPGFERAAAILTAHGRPLTAFCACELRSPRQFSDEGFRACIETLRKYEFADRKTSLAVGLTNEGARRSGA